MGKLELISNWSALWFKYLLIYVQLILMLYCNVWMMFEFENSLH